MSFILAQLSDTHIDDGQKDEPGPASTLALAVARASEENADAIMITGDLVENGRRTEYELLRQALEFARVPVFVIPGNHDDPEVLRAAFADHHYLPSEGRLSYCVDDWPVRIVAVDQHLPGADGGLLTEVDARWLDASLLEMPSKPTIVALHHPPFHVHDSLFDNAGLSGTERLLDVVARHPQVERVICGHYHRAAVSRFANTLAVVCPSTAWTYKLNLENGRPAMKQPHPLGLALHVWSAEAGLATHFLWL